VSDGYFVPFRSKEKWDRNHVRLPCSNNSKYAHIDKNGEKHFKSRWEFIERALLRDFKESKELEASIKSYNNRHDKYWNFKALHELVETEMDHKTKSHYFNVTLPGIIRLALRLPQLVQCSIPFLKKGSNKSISMTQIQIGSLLANAFLCTFPSRPSNSVNHDKKESEFSNYPEINFNRLFGCDDKKVAIEKLKCILNYFNRIILQEDRARLSGVVTFQRICIEQNQMINWNEYNKSFADIKLHVTCDRRKPIEEGHGMLQVDFANKFVGGGVLGHGCVQEEIRFLINPELIVSKLFTECLDPEEALTITGSEQFNSYTGYSSSFEWKDNFQDNTPRDNFLRKKTKIVAIDALPYPNPRDQFKESNIIRDINKAYAGFSNYNDADKQPVCSGLWGAGAFKGHPIKSALIQMIACRATWRNLAFFTFGDEVVAEQIFKVFTFLKERQTSIAALLNTLKKFKGNLSDNNALINFIMDEISLRNTKDNSRQESLFKFKFTLSKQNEKAKKLESTPLPALPVLLESSSEINSMSPSSDIIQLSGSKLDETEKAICKPRRSMLDVLDKDFYS
jgi:poly(ADP-ribose) glycohydrolase